MKPTKSNQEDDYEDYALKKDNNNNNNNSSSKGIIFLWILDSEFCPKRWNYVFNWIELQLKQMWRVMIRLMLRGRSIRLQSSGEEVRLMKGMYFIIL